MSYRKLLGVIVVLGIIVLLVGLWKHEEEPMDFGLIVPMSATPENATINEVWAPSNIGRGKLFRAYANITANSTIVNLTCNLTGADAFMPLADYPVSKNIGAVGNGTEVIINWTLAAAKALGYYNLNVTCSNVTTIVGATKKRIKVNRE